LLGSNEGFHNAGLDESKDARADSNITPVILITGKRLIYFPPHAYGEEMHTLQFSSSEFTTKATTFFNDKPQELNGFPVIRLLLFLDPRSLHYDWYSLSPKDKMQSVVEYYMEKKVLIPIGAAALSFVERGDGRIHLSDTLPSFIDPPFNSEEVLSQTIPYFMRDTFGYKLDQIKISDLASYLTPEAGAGKSAL